MRKLPEGYWALFKVIHDRIVPLFKAGVHPALLNPVFGLPQPKGVPKPPAPSANERYWIDWMQEFMEINSAINRLNQSLIYLGHFPGSKPFRFHGLSEADWLRYHVEVYLQEIYILSDRLSRFLRRVGKTAAAAGDRDGVAWARREATFVTSAFANAIKARGGHVHRYRFEDTELRDLDTLVLVTKPGRLRTLRGFRKFKYVTALEKWRKQIKESNKGIIKLCADLFGAAARILVRNEPVRP